MTPLEKLEEKVSARLAEGQELGLGVFLCHLHAVYVVEVQGGVSHGEELLFALETDYVCHIPLIYFNLQIIGEVMRNLHCKMRCCSTLYPCRQNVWQGKSDV